ncbi:MAG: hypothetical protein GY860_21100 [Desulfobacteraceae bacterium]|nr:hypothetical protein [Desulfobacteraceae bacterium]
MYALIYDDHSLDESYKKVISVDGTREESEKVLEQRQKELGKRVWECNTRIVWTDKAVAPGDMLKTDEFVTWRPGEDIPEGELHSNED